MFNPPHDALGKFVSPKVLKLVLEGRTLRWSRPGTFNDPLDCQPRFRYAPDRSVCLPEMERQIALIMSGEVATFSPGSQLPIYLNWIADSVNNGEASIEKIPIFLRGLFDNAFLYSPKFEQEFCEKVIEYFSSAKILCLSKSFDNILMWSHYAENHKGALLVFAPRSNDRERLINRFGSAEFAV